MDRYTRAHTHRYPFSPHRTTNTNGLRLSGLPETPVILPACVPMRADRWGASGCRAASLLPYNPLPHRTLHNTALMPLAQIPALLALTLLDTSPRPYLLIRTYSTQCNGCRGSIEVQHPSINVIWVAVEAGTPDKIGYHQLLVCLDLNSR